MSKEMITRRNTKEKRISPKEKPHNNGFLSKQLKKVYPICFLKSTSPLSLSSLSLSLSEKSNDSTQTDASLPLDQKIFLALRRLAPPQRREYKLVPKNIEKNENTNVIISTGELGRCNWITKNSDKTYVQFHDECWGVPIYDDNRLFEMLAMSGMLMDHNWTEILKQKELFRGAFYGFDPTNVAKIGEKEINEIISNKEIALSETRVRCIIDNSKCIVQIMKEYGSFSNFIWEYVNFKPTINKFKYPRNVPLRSPKAEIISKDLLKRGFRFVGPVIVYSFMQAAGLTIDHLVDCYRFSECVRIAERPWRHL